MTITWSILFKQAGSTLFNFHIKYNLLLLSSATLVKIVEHPDFIWTSQQLVCHCLHLAAHTWSDLTPASFFWCYFFQPTPDLNTLYYSQIWADQWRFEVLHCRGDAVLGPSKQVLIGTFVWKSLQSSNLGSEVELPSGRPVQPLSSAWTSNAQLPLMKPCKLSGCQAALATSAYLQSFNGTDFKLTVTTTSAEDQQ